MVSRFSLIFWRWVVVLHDQLHDARDKAIAEAIHEKYGVWRGDKDFLEANFGGGIEGIPNEFEWSGKIEFDTETISGTPNVTYTSPAVHYLGSRRETD